MEKRLACVPFGAVCGTIDRRNNGRVVGAESRADWEAMKGIHSDATVDRTIETFCDELTDTSSVTIDF